MRSKELTAVASETLGDSAIQVEVTLPVRPRRHESGKGGLDSVSTAGSRSRTPRITRLMALAIKFQDMVDRGEVRDYADLARLGYVTRARMTQIMNLLNLAPKIQEAILLGGFASTAAQPSERDLRVVCSMVFWSEQIARCPPNEREGPECPYSPQKVLPMKEKGVPWTSTLR
jgi:hypothetical protein